MATPLISVCLPNLNTRRFLEERIETIRNQTFADWELVISDNYSDDGSWELFQKYAGDPRIKLAQAPRRGMYANWNECLQRAIGRYCYVATSDDTMSPDCLEKLATALEARPDLDIAVCDFQEIDVEGRPLESEPPPYRVFLGDWLSKPSIRDGKTEFLLHAAFGSTVWVTMTAVMFRRQLLRKTGLFKTDVGVVGDIDWTLRASLASDIAYIPEKLATWRIHPTQGSCQSPALVRRGQMLKLARSVVYDRDAGIPAPWKSVPCWDRQVLSVFRRRYLQSVRLHRSEARRNPKRFLRHAWRAFQCDPGLVRDCATRGFNVVPESSIDFNAAARAMLDGFQAKWPPSPVSRW